MYPNYLTILNVLLKSFIQNIFHCKINAVDAWKIELMILRHLIKSRLVYKDYGIDKLQNMEKKIVKCYTSIEFVLFNEYFQKM